MSLKRSERDARYNAKVSKYYSLKFNVNTDADVIAHLDLQESVNGYIRRLIREDIARHAGEPDPRQP